MCPMSKQQLAVLFGFVGIALAASQPACVNDVEDGSDFIEPGRAEGFGITVVLEHDHDDVVEVRHCIGDDPPCLRKLRRSGCAESATGPEH